MAPKEKNIKKAPGDIIPSGLVILDEKNNEWIVGKSIGEGGCGRVYLVSNDINTKVPDDSPYVIKVTLGSPTEYCFYSFFPYSFTLEEYKKSKNLKHIGVPKCFGGGCFFHKGKGYKFVIIERLPIDLQTILNEIHKTLPYKTVYQIAIQILDVLELLHSDSYVHMDIKASNIMVKHRPGTENKIFLVDYGQAEHFTLEIAHNEFLEEWGNKEPKYTHCGAIPYASRDTHCRAHTRRGDVETLSFNLIKWMSGQLPWEENYEDLDSLVNMKFEMMDDVPKFLNICFPDGAPPGIQEFVEYAKSLTFEEMPDFERMRGILENHLKDDSEKDTDQPGISQLLGVNCPLNA